MDLQLSIDPAERLWSGTARLHIKALPLFAGTSRFDLDMVREVRNLWQFFRDRRPETYTELVDK